MQRHRFRIGSLLGFILFCGLAFACVRESTDWWEKGTFTLIVLVLLAAVLLAIHRSGDRQSILAWIRPFRPRVSVALINSAGRIEADYVEGPGLCLPADPNVEHNIRWPDDRVRKSGAAEWDDCLCFKRLAACKLERRARFDLDLG